jgi:hypothetical protein
MPHVLEPAQPPQHDRVAEVDVGRSGVDPELHPQRATLALRLGQLGLETPVGQAIDRPAGQLGGRLRVARPRRVHPGQC